VYNSETLCVEESMHIKFDDKEPANETPEQGGSFAGMQVPEDTSELVQNSDSEESPKVVPTPEVQDEEAEGGKNTRRGVELCFQKLFFLTKTTTVLKIRV